MSLSKNGRDYHWSIGNCLVKCMFGGQESERKKKAGVFLFLFIFFLFFKTEEWRFFPNSVFIYLLRCWCGPFKWQLYIFYFFINHVCAMCHMPSKHFVNHISNFYHRVIDNDQNETLLKNSRTKQKTFKNIRTTTKTHKI